MVGSNEQFYSLKLLTTSRPVHKEQLWSKPIFPLKKSKYLENFHKVCFIVENKGYFYQLMLLHIKTYLFKLVRYIVVTIKTYNGNWCCSVVQAVMSFPVPPGLELQAS